METLQVTQLISRIKGWQKMNDYSMYLLEIKQTMQMVHKATLARDYKTASDLAAKVAKYAMSLSALLEIKTETEI